MAAPLLPLAARAAGGTAAYAYVLKIRIPPVMRTDGLVAGPDHAQVTTETRFRFVKAVGFRRMHTGA